MTYKVQCINCKSTTTNLLNYRCRCGFPFEMAVNIAFSPSKLMRSTYSVWRYREFFPYVDEQHIISLGEGWTPLVKCNENLVFKLDFLNPTGSFKDRGSSPLISTVWKMIKDSNGYISEDSSGNAGASIAAYAARAGLQAKIFVPNTVTGPKFDQLRLYGAEVVKVMGERSKVAAEAQMAEKGKVYIGHIWHPIFRDGMKTLIYEVAEQLEWKLPNFVYVPVSAGTLLLGVIKGLEHLVESGMVNEVPTIVACQTKQVSPLYHRLNNIPFPLPEKITSIADALVSVNPPLLEIMVKKMRKIGGDAEIVDEDQIYTATLDLARKGLYVEPSSAVAFAAYKERIKHREDTIKEKSLIVLTGTGLKTTLHSAR